MLLNDGFQSKFDISYYSYINFLSRTRVGSEKCMIFEILEDWALH